MSPKPASVRLRRPASTEATAIAAARSAIQPQPAGEEGGISAWARQQARRRRLLVWTARAGTLLIVVGGWQLFTSWKIVSPFFFGQPSGIVLKLRDWAEHGTAYGSLWLQIGITMKEALLGFTFGVAGGVVFGILLGQVRFLADVLGPYIKAMNALPRIVLGSIFVVWLGLGTTSKVMLAAVLVFFVVFFNAFQGVREVDRNFVAHARVLGASRFQITRHVVLPSALTWIIASLHVAFGFAIIGAIVGEFLGAQKGLGLVIATAQNNFDPDGVFAAMLIIAILALTAEALISRLERRLLAWRPPAPSEASPI
jgi:NitT/TauT family transport system permease protein